MQRHERLDRSHMRAVRAGILISAAVHAAALGLIGFSGPAPGDEQADPVAATAPEAPAEAMQAPDEPVIQVVALRAAPAPNVAAAASSPTVSAAPAPEPAVQAAAVSAPVAEPAVALAEVVEVPAAVLAMVEPEAAPGGAVLAGEPAEAAARPDALEPEPAAAEAEEYELPAGVPLYVPGSVGRAKGKWAGTGARGGDHTGGPRRGVIVIGVGRDGRRCPPLPGRGRIPPMLRPPPASHFGPPAGR